MTLFALSLLSPALAADTQHEEAIARVEQMVMDSNARSLVTDQGLNLMNVTWEDTGRNSGSSVGPNISDMTIGVRDSHGKLHPMPVMRYDNFSDKTADLRSDSFWLQVGNATGDDLQAVSIEDVLKHTDRYLSGADGSIKGSLWADRDEHLLVSAQAAFLPVPKKGAATFTPVIYNYQSSPGAPAVLTIVATREGTSIQVVDNRDGYMSDVLFFDQDGERAPFTAERLSDFKASGKVAMGSVTAGSEDGLNTVLVAQVPLKVERRAPMGIQSMSYAEGAPIPTMSRARGRSDVEQAVVGHGPTEGRFRGLGGTKIERDERFPVRVTVQFYQATSNGIVSEEDVMRLRKQIDRVYAEGDYVGSLVTTAPTQRPTDWRSSSTAVWADSTSFYPSVD